MATHGEQYEGVEYGEEEEEEYFDDEEDEEDDDDLVPDRILSIRVVKGKRMVEVVFKGKKTSQWVAENMFLYPGMVKRFEAEAKSARMSSSDDSDQGHAGRSPRGGRQTGRGVNSRGSPRGGRGGSTSVGRGKPAPPSPQSQLKPPPAAAPPSSNEQKPPALPRPPPIPTYEDVLRNCKNENKVSGTTAPRPFTVKPFADLSPPYDPFAGMQTAVAPPPPPSEEVVSQVIHAIVDEAASDASLAKYSASLRDDHVRELAWTCAALTSLSLHGCRNLTKKSFKALGDAPQLTSLDLSEALVPLNGFSLFCAKAAPRLQHLNLTRMLYRRTQLPKVATSVGCMPWVEAALRVCGELKSFRCVDAHPVLPVEPPPEARHWLGNIALRNLEVLELSDRHTTFHLSSILVPRDLVKLTRLQVAGIFSQLVHTLTSSPIACLTLLPAPMLDLTLLDRAPSTLEITTGEPDFLCRWKLRELHLVGLRRSMQISSVLMWLFTAAPFIEEFHVSYVHGDNMILKGRDIAIPPNCFPYLQSVSFENADWMDGFGISHLLRRSPHLRHIGLTGSTTSRLPLEVFQTLCSFTQLQSLDITLPSDDAAAQLTALPLVSLRLYRSPISIDTIGKLLQKFSTTLTQLDLASTPYSLNFPSKQLIAAIGGNTKKLESLRVYHCSFRWELPETSSNHNHLLASLRLLQTCGCTVAKSGNAMGSLCNAKVNIRIEPCLWETW